MPRFLALIVWCILFLPRVIVVMVLPGNACYKWHRLNKVWDFVRFG